jgi:hypothetical protein
MYLLLDVRAACGATHDDLDLLLDERLAPQLPPLTQYCSQPTREEHVAPRTVDACSVSRVVLPVLFGPYLRGWSVRVPGRTSSRRVHVLD